MVDVSERMKRDTVLGENSEVGIGGVVEESGGYQPTRGRDEGRRGSIRSLRLHESSLENAGGGARDIDGWIGMDINIVQIGRTPVEESIPKRSEMEVGVGEEEKGDLQFRIFGGKVGEFRRVVWIGGKLRSGPIEERDVIKLIVERNGDVGLTRREDSWGEK